MIDKTEVFDYMAANGHEKVLFFQNEDVGLRAVLAIHSTVLGPAAGGCRMWPGSCRATPSRSILGAA